MHKLMVKLIFLFQLDSIQHTALRLIMGFGNVDIQMQLSLPKFTSDPKQVI